MAGMSLLMQHSKRWAACGSRYDGLMNRGCGYDKSFLPLGNKTTDHVHLTVLCLSMWDRK